jgi:hypothetical protein
MRIQKALIPVVILLICALGVRAQSKPKLTLDEFFNSVSVSGLEISPDGTSVVIAAERADWDQQIFRTDLWLYRDDAKSLNPDTTPNPSGRPTLAGSPSFPSAKPPPKNPTTPIRIRKTKTPARST